ncbi:hypothetical protein GCM10019059_43310 [Camelimonas fluminis]|uniref:Rap1a/Tai family immunity protein n=1 Tax=Camelimonas fluminis TaxID=1576911 RepID=A0ABV7UP18_9HYPH|nr:Rap1a/Tai family immunity protein [Camelimonas fluminis]GHE80430.1 hypothetical protein GCM10019059_43310 [Camelimonas fluminis]
MLMPRDKEGTIQQAYSKGVAHTITLLRGQPNLCMPASISILEVAEQIGAHRKTRPEQKAEPLPETAVQAISEVWPCRSAGRVCWFL